MTYVQYGTYILYSTCSVDRLYSICANTASIRYILHLTYLLYCAILQPEVWTGRLQRFADELGSAAKWERIDSAHFTVRFSLSTARIHVFGRKHGRRVLRQLARARAVSALAGAREC